jgi:DNA-binding transcriptional LysR family regulator
MMEQLTHLVTFARVVQAGSFAAAAKRLQMTPSVASKHVAKLEQRLGAILLQRSTRKLSLTEAGSAYFEHCARILEELDQSQQAVARLQAAPTGHLRVSCLPSFATSVLAPMVPAFFKRYPKIELELVGTERIVDLAEDGFDLALRITREPAQTLVARALGPIRFVICASPAYYRRHSKPKRPADLTQHNCLGYTTGSASNTWRFLRDAEQVEVPVSGSFQANSIDAVRTLALSGVGVALLPTYSVGDDLRARRLISSFADYRGFNLTTLYAAYLPNRYGSPKLRAFIDFLANKIGTPPYWDRGLAGMA